MMNFLKSPYVFFAAVVFTLFLNPVWALLFGIALGMYKLLYNPPKLSTYRKYTLEAAVVLLGFGLSFQQVISVGSKGIYQTAAGIIILLIIGTVLGYVFKLNKKLSVLINVGTCICGGSAIAAVSGAIDAKDDDIAISTGVVFLLNAAALFMFPVLFINFQIPPEIYGVWCALSIHDTSSVVGAASVNETSLAIATILKLTRTLWIIPLTIFYKILYKSNGSSKFPYFIALFVLSTLITTFLPLDIYKHLASYGKMLMSPALFMVGYAINLDTIKSAGKASILYGVLLWGVSIILGYLIAVSV